MKYKSKLKRNSKYNPHNKKSHLTSVERAD